jgi:glutamyl-tRNA(Gln) amidotransferase subunit D
MGVIPLGDMLPETALVKMMWTLGNVTTPAEAKMMMTENLAGEFSNRRVLEGSYDE